MENTDEHHDDLHTCDTALYILQVTKDKLTSAHLKLLKGLMLYIMKRVKKTFILEAHLDSTINLEYGLL